MSLLHVNNDAVVDLPKTHDVVVMKPTQDPASAYRIAIPKGWLGAKAIENIEEGLGIPLPLGLFAASTDATAPAIVVQRTRLPVEVRIQDWVRWRCLHEQWRISAEQWVKTDEGHQLEARLLRAGGARRSWGVMRAWVDAGRLFTVMAMASERDWPSLSEALSVSVSSMALGKPTGDETFEARTSHGLDRDEPLRVDLPRSWSVSARADTASSVLDARALSNRGLAAYLRVKRKPGLRPFETLLGETRSELAEVGIAIARQGEPWEPPGVSAEGWEGGMSSLATFAGDTVQVWRAFRHVNHSSLSFIAVAPRASDNAFVWMRTQRALDLAIGSLQSDEISN